MSEFVYFRDSTTGKVVYAPRAWENLFPNLVEVSEEEAECVDCWPKPEEAEWRRVDDVTFDNPIHVGSRDESFSQGDLADLDSDEPEDTRDGE